MKYNFIFSLILHFTCNKVERSEQFQTILSKYKIQNIQMSYKTNDKSINAIQK